MAVPAFFFRFAVRHSIIHAFRFIVGFDADLERLRQSMRLRLERAVRKTLSGIRVRLDDRAASFLLNKLSDEREFRKIQLGAMRAAAKVVAEHVRATAPYRKGTLRRSVRVRATVRRGEPIGMVIAGSSRGRYRKEGWRDAYYAAWVEHGTRPHRIVARDGAMFFGGTYRRGVQHPGARAMRFMQQAAERAAPLIRPTIENYVRRRVEAIEREAGSRSAPRGR